MTAGGPVEFHPTGAEDADVVLAMEADPDTRPWLGESSRAWHTADGVEHLLAHRDGVLVGFVVLAGPRGTETGTELRRIVVAAEHRGRGHGRAMLRAVLAHVPTGRVWLDVKPGNERALALYAGEGFVVERELPADPRNPDGPVALLVLAREVYSAGSSGSPS
ncbi:GNAT family N-acetyltransferase [Pseudonocardia endophytica]|uniref:Ribosomal protein S18 acetylase RimI-like enzyme n=1 Tax=Pseudonocardia endophytica TaxID=401976 RepID=A0A4R1HXQ0_PSEEN|nr:GNAT family N-acetyltransferase [Pseudonocardia endophytica]TCK24849.1 ribosomal protein S18 acetylase RimI-like enzyme [Pseudonocardia endophytica]